MFKILILSALMMCSLAQSSPSVGCASVYEFKYPNGSCLPTCPYPYKDSWHNQSYFCYPPCPTGYFNIWTEDCQDSCKPEDVTIVDEILRCDVDIDSTNSTGCLDPNEFKHPNGSCLASCAYPYETHFRDGSYFCEDPCPGAFFVEEDQSCVQMCDYRTDYYSYYVDVAVCPKKSYSKDACPRYERIKYFDGSCRASCDFPFEYFWDISFPICKPKCRWPNPDYWSTSLQSCTPYCKEEYVRKEFSVNVCDEPFHLNSSRCPLPYDYYKFPNGSCLEECPKPRTVEGEDGFYFCNSPCPAGSYFKPNTQTCVDICEAGLIKIEDDIVYCLSYPSVCPNEDYKWRYLNGSCLSSCPEPYLNRSDGTYNSCYPPCFYPDFYNTWDKSCGRYCEPEFTKLTPYLWICERPVNTSNGCPNALPFKYFNGTCESSCEYPFTSQTNNGSLRCVPDCAADQYWNVYTQRCIGDCEHVNIREQDSILYCDLVPRWNSPNGCPFSFDFKYPNGKCLTDCPSPLIAEIDYGNSTCNTPCPDQFFHTSTQSCVDTCLPRYVRTNVTNGIEVQICDNPSLDPNSECPNPDDYLYYNGSCSPSCPYPYKERWMGSTRTCILPCMTGLHFSPVMGCVVRCNADFIRQEDDISFCDQFDACRNLNEIRYLNGSCLSSCEDPFKNIHFWGNESFPAACVCSDEKDFFNPLTGRCVKSCPKQYRIFENTFSYCYQSLSNSTENNTGSSYSATIGIYLRYNIPLKDFNAGGYLAKFKTMMAKLLGVSDSEIKIIKISEGSTIIESEVELKSESLAASESKANALNQKLTEAAELKDLNLEGVGVLSHKFSVVIPESGTENENDDVDADKSSSKGLAIGLGVGLGVVAVGSVTLLVYTQYQKKQKLLRVREQIKGKSKTVDETPRRRDEEICSLKTPGADLENNKKVDIIEEKLEEIQVENRGPLSMEDIMKNIEEH